MTLAGAAQQETPGAFGCVCAPGRVASLQRLVEGNSLTVSRALTSATRPCDDPAQHQERGCPTRAQPEPYQGGNRGPMRITGDAVPRRDKDGGMTRPERVFVF